MRADVRTVSCDGCTPSAAATDVVLSASAVVAPAVFASGTPGSSTVSVTATPARFTGPRLIWDSLIVSRDDTSLELRVGGTSRSDSDSFVLGKMVCATEKVMLVVCSLRRVLLVASLTAQVGL